MYHNRQLFLPDFAPVGFTYAVRRPGHDPEGTLSIEDGDSDPMATLSRRIPKGHTMKFALSPAVKVAFEGTHHVHAAVFHNFSDSSSSTANRRRHGGRGGGGLKLIARARQFSSFILMVGSLGGPELFQPKHAIIVQNKDELTLPLELETIPAPQEFRDAIESLSPEQQVRAARCCA